MQCPICQFNCATRASFKHHIKGKHKEVSTLELENLYTKYVLNVEVSFQDIINDYLSGLCFEDLIVKYSIPRNNIQKILKLYNIKLRTNSESKQTEQYQKKYTSTIKEKYGVENISIIPEIKEKKKQTSLKNNGYVNNFCNSEIKNKAQDNRTTSYTSSLELRIHKILNELKITYTSNKYIGKYNYDILFENKCILEIQGDFWHGNPIKYKENDILFGGKTAKMIWNKDLKKKEFVEKKGFKIFYLWETDINKMKDEDIINFLKEVLI